MTTVSPLPAAVSARLMVMNGPTVPTPVTVGEDPSKAVSLPPSMST